MANLVLPVPHQAQFFLRAPLRGEEALRAARAPGKLARSWWSGPAACTPTGWRWLWRAGKSCVHGAPRSGSRRLEAERLGRLDWWGAGVLDLDSRRCWRPCGRASSSLVTARCRAVQRDHGWQQQQRGSGGGGGEEQEKLRSRADAGRTAMRGELSSPARSSPPQRAQGKTADVDASKDTRTERTLRTIIGTERKEITVQAQTGPILKVGRH